MCSLNETAHFLCGIASSAVQPRLHVLNKYFENEKRDLGVEYWLQIELVAALRCKNYSVTIQPHHDGEEPDLAIKPPRNCNTYMVELKAGNFCNPFKDRNDASFLGCLFLGRFDIRMESIREKLQQNGCSLIYLQYLGDSSETTKWWVGFVRKSEQSTVGLRRIRV
jgi:hypothetical protein